MADNLTCMDRETDSLPDGSSDDENSEPDPRIQKELDLLNQSSTEINRLENELDEARTKYRSIVSGTSGAMETVAKGRKKNIQKAREYYRLATEAKLAQSEALKAARQYQTASGIYNAAKETVALAEHRLVEKTSSSAAQLSSAWQEMLNHAIHRVTVAETEKAKSEQDHRRRSAKFAELETRKQLLEKKFAKSIKKARPYFELKAEMDMKLMQQKQNVIDLQAAIKCNKALYNESLRKLESISEEIHQNRREKLWARIPRMPCVGADTESLTSDMSELDIVSAMNCEDMGSDTTDGMNDLILNEAICNLQKTDLELEEPDGENVNHKSSLDAADSGIDICDNNTTSTRLDIEEVFTCRDITVDSCHGNNTTCEHSDAGTSDTSIQNEITSDNLNEISEQTHAGSFTEDSLKQTDDSVTTVAKVEDTSNRVTKETTEDSGDLATFDEQTSIQTDDVGSNTADCELDTSDMHKVPRPCASGAE